MALDWLVYALGVIAVVFLVGMFFKYKKHNRYADKFEDTYPDARYNNEEVLLNEAKEVFAESYLTQEGEILGMDDNAREIGGRLGWNIK